MSRFGSRFLVKERIDLFCHRRKFFFEKGASESPCFHFFSGQFKRRQTANRKYPMCPPTTFEQRAEIYAHMLARLRAKDSVGVLDVKELAKRIQTPVHRVSRVIRRFQEHVPRNKWLSTLAASPQVCILLCPRR